MRIDEFSGAGAKRVPQSLRCEGATDTTLPRVKGSLHFNYLHSAHKANVAAVKILFPAPHPLPLNLDMLRRKPTAITLTSEDLTAYEDSRAMRQLQYENKSLDGTRQVETAHSDAMQGNRQGVVDPNDELKPLPGDKARVGRSGMSREERIVGR